MTFRPWTAQRKPALKTTLTKEKMKNIKGKKWRHKHWHPWKWRCSYHWKGWKRVYNRVKYGYKVFIGAAIFMGGLEGGNILARIGGVSGLDYLNEGLNEYMAHYNEVC